MGNDSKENWHESLISVTKKIASETGSSPPLDNVDCVRKARNYLDYALLASSTLFSQIGERYYGKCSTIAIAKKEGARSGAFITFGLFSSPQYAHLT